MNLAAKTRAPASFGRGGALRIFDVEEAKRCIPLLGATFTAIRGWVRRIQECTNELQALGEPAEIRAPAADIYSRGGVLRAERDQLIAKIQEEVGQLEEFGIEVKSLEGLVDFRALRSGRQVCLCWQFGELTVSFWHELDRGFGGRRPIDDVSAFETTYQS
jgi:hypothetical protein